MPSCVLRICGETFRVEDFLATTTFAEAVLQRKGGGFNVEVGGAEDDVRDQTRVAIAFLRANATEIARARAFPGVDDLTLDFASAFRDVAAQFARFPAELVKLAGELGIALEVSIYAVEG